MQKIKHEKLAEGVEIYLGDCLDVMQDIDDFDLIVTSPPYNVGIDYADQGYKNDKKPLDEYIEFARSFMRSVKLVSGGRLCLEIGSSGRNFPMSYLWQDAAYKAGLGLFSEIVLQHRKSNPCAWGSYLKADALYTIPNFHMMYVFYNISERKNGDETTITKDEWMEWTRGLWNVNYSIGSTKAHPAQFPVEFSNRCIRLFGHKGDRVLDPFLGSGTTALSCIDNGRSFVGIELTEKYYELAKKRIKRKLMQPKMF